MPLDAAPSVLWTLSREGTVASCEALFVPSGIEVKVLRNGTFLLSQTFTSGEAALDFAEEEKARMLNSGWVQGIVVRRARESTTFAIAQMVLANLRGGIRLVA